MFKTGRALFLTCAWAIAGNSYAGVISITPFSKDVIFDTQFTVDLSIDFLSPAVLGGGIELTYDPSMLQFDGFAYNSDPSSLYSGSNFPAIALSEDFTHSATTGKIHDIGIVSAFGIPGYQALPLSGVLGTFTFTPVATGSSDLLIRELNSGEKAGQFVTDGSVLINPTINNGTVNVSAVPLPATIWFLLGGLGTLFGFKRKTRKVQN